MANKEAMTLVMKLKRNGIMKYPNNCQYCNSEPKRFGNSLLHAHHDDYLMPNRVVFLCSKCHRQVHSGKIKIAKELYTEITHTLPIFPRDRESKYFNNMLKLFFGEIAYNKIAEKAKNDSRTIAGWIYQLINRETSNKNYINAFNDGYASAKKDIIKLISQSNRQSKE